MPGTVLGAGDAAVDKIEISDLGGLMVKQRRLLGCLPFSDGLYYRVLSSHVSIAAWTGWLFDQGVGWSIQTLSPGNLEWGNERSLWVSGCRCWTRGLGDRGYRSLCVRPQV